MRWCASALRHEDAADHVDEDPADGDGEHDRRERRTRAPQLGQPVEERLQDTTSTPVTIPVHTPLIEAMSGITFATPTPVATAATTVATTLGSPRRREAETADAAAIDTAQLSTRDVPPSVLYAEIHPAAETATTRPLTPPTRDSTRRSRPSPRRSSLMNARSTPMARTSGRLRSHGSL